MCVCVRFLQASAEAAKLTQEAAIDALRKEVDALKSVSSDSVALAAQIELNATLKADVAAANDKIASLQVCVCVCVPVRLSCGVVPMVP